MWKTKTFILLFLSILLVTATFFRELFDLASIRLFNVSELAKEDAVHGKSNSKLSFTSKDEISIQDVIIFFEKHGYGLKSPERIADAQNPSEWPTELRWYRKAPSSNFRKDSFSSNRSNQRLNKDHRGVRMYRHDMTKWNPDIGMCKAQGDFLFATMNTPAGDVKIYVHNPNADVFVSAFLIQEGAWEPHLIQLVYSLLHDDPSTQFIDFGANLGVFSLAVAKFGRKVIAVEPLSINLQRFCRSIAENSFQDKITVVTNALGNVREIVTFGKNENNVGGTYIFNNKNLEKQRGSDFGGKYNDVVLTAKVDDILNLPGFDFKKVVIKMDVEGYEHYVLQGATEFFSKVDVVAVLMEWMWHKAGSGSDQIFNFYFDRGYEPFDVVRKVVLDYKEYQMWPMDVLWRKNPS